MYNAVVVEICDGGERRSDQVGGIRLVVIAFPADAIEQLASERQVGHEVDYAQSQLCAQPGNPANHTVVHGLKVVDQGENVPVAHGDSLQHSDLVSDLICIISLGSDWATGCPRTMCSRPAISLLLMTFAA